MSITSDELNFLVYRYLQESGFVHSAFVFAYESLVGRANLATADIPPGALINFLQKGLQYAEIEKELEQRGAGDMMNGIALLSGSREVGRSDDPMDLSGEPSKRAKNSSTSSSDQGETGPGTGKTTLDLEGKAKPSPDENILVSPGDVTELKGHNTEVVSCAWNPIFDVLASAGGSKAFLWNIPRGASGLPAASAAQQDYKVLNPSDGAGEKVAKGIDVVELDWKLDGQLLASGSYDGTGRIWSLKGDLVHTLSCHKGIIFAVKWNRAGNYLVTGSVDKTAVVWNADTGSVVQQFEHHNGPVLDVDWRNDTEFATASADRTIGFCRVGLSSPVLTFEGHADEINAVRWNHAGQLLASCSDDCTVKIWKADDRSAVLDWDDHNAEVKHISWAPQGTGTTGRSLLASASDDKTVRIWDVESGRCSQTLAGHSRSVLTVAFSPNGQFVASGSTDQRVKIWSVKDGKCVKEYRGGAGVLSLSWNKDGDKIAAGFDFPSKSVCVVDFRK